MFEEFQQHLNNTPHLSTHIWGENYIKTKIHIKNGFGMYDGKYIYPQILNGKLQIPEDGYYHVWIGTYPFNKDWIQDPNKLNWKFQKELNDCNVLEKEKRIEIRKSIKQKNKVYAESINYLIENYSGCNFYDIVKPVYQGEYSPSVSKIKLENYEFDTYENEYPRGTFHEIRWQQYMSLSYFLSENIEDKDILRFFDYRFNETLDRYKYYFYNDFCNIDNWNFIFLYSPGYGDRDVYRAEAKPCLVEIFNNIIELAYIQYMKEY